MQALLRLLSPVLRRFLWLPQLFSFACVGVAGLAADAFTLWLLLDFAGLDPYTGRLLSYVAAATVTWALNRHFTFRGQGRGGLLRQWFTFLIANLSGFAANYATYALCITFVPYLQSHHLLALVPASIIGLLFNFTASKKLVFK